MNFLGLDAFYFGLDLAEGPNDLLIDVRIGPELADLLLLLFCL